MDLRTVSLVLLAMLICNTARGSPTYQWSQRDCNTGGEDYGYDNYQGPSYQETLQGMIAETLVAIRDIVRITSQAMREELAYIAQKLSSLSWECEPEVYTSEGPGEYPFTGYPGQPTGSPIPFSEGEGFHQNEITNSSFIDVRFGEELESSKNAIEENITSNGPLQSTDNKRIENYTLPYIQKNNETSQTNEVNSSTLNEQPLHINIHTLGNVSTTTISVTNLLSTENSTEVDNDNDTTLKKDIAK